MTVSSIPSYDFLAPGRIVFGWGRWPEVGRIAAGLGRRVFVVLGSRTLAAGDFVAQLQQTLRESHVESIMLSTITREPEVADIDLITNRIRQHQLRDAVVLAVGGGSAIDTGKAVAALATQEAGSVKDYLEGVGRGAKLTARPLGVIAMPTTAGTGSEATKNAVISSYDPPFKKSLRSDAMMPCVAIVDPQLTVSVPPAITAQTGMDAITQLIESYLSRKARPVPQALAAQGLRLALDAIVEAVENGGSRPAREAMAQAALLSGMALANSGLGMAHGVAAALGVHFRVPHGLACAILLPVALGVNRPVCEPQLADLARSAGLVGHVSQTAAADALVERVDQICQRIAIPRNLAQWKVSAEQLALLVRDSRGNSMDGNPRSLSDPELTQILEALL